MKQYNKTIFDVIPSSENVDIPTLVPFAQRYPHKGYDIELDNDGACYPQCCICLKEVDPATAYSVHRSVLETILRFGAKTMHPDGVDPEYNEDGYGGLGWPLVGPSCKRKVRKDCLYPAGWKPVEPPE